MSPITIALVSGLLAMIGWGLSDVFAKKRIVAIGYHKAFIYIQLTGLVLSIPLFLIIDGGVDLSLKNLFFLLLFAGFDVAGYLLLYKAYQIGKVSVINPISSSWAILAAIFSFLFFGETFTTQKVLTLLLVAVGIFFASVDFKQLRDGFQTKDLSKGVPLAVLVFIVYGFFVPVFDRYIVGQNWIVVLILLQFFNLLIGLSYTKFWKKVTIQVKDTSIIFWLVIAGLLEGIANIAFIWGLSASTETSITSVISSAYPLVVVLAAYFILREKVAKNQYLGVGMITLGIILLGLL